MIPLTTSQYITPENYLEWESQQDIKHEYLDGEVYGMTGGTLPHNDIANGFVVGALALNPPNIPRS